MDYFNTDLGNSDLLNSETGFLAHYTTRETAIEGLLISASIRFSTRKKVNDPRESRLRGSSVGWGGNEGRQHVPSLMAKFRNAVDQYLQIFCLSASDSESFVDLIGQSYCLPNMWAHYGGNHQGVCFLFNEEKLIKLIPKELFMMAKMVSYKGYLKDDYEFTQFGDLSIIDSQFGGDISRYVQEHCIEKCEELFFHKDLCWKSEQEFRILIYSESNNDCTYFPFRDALEGVVLGVDFVDAYLPAFERMLPEGVSLARLEWDSIGFRYKLNNVGRFMKIGSGPD